MAIKREAFTAVCSWYVTTQECAMNAFVEHHNNSIQFGYRCFDRLLLNGLIQPFQQPERVLGFFNTYRDGKRVTRRTLTEMADQFQYGLKNRSEKWAAPILEPPDGAGDDSRRDQFMDPYFENAKPKQVVAILKAREPARILVAIGDRDNDSPHLEYEQRWVNQFEGAFCAAPVVPRRPQRRGSHQVGQFLCNRSGRSPGRGIPQAPLRLPPCGETPKALL
jgi:hypothetical protein